MIFKAIVCNYEIMEQFRNSEPVIIGDSSDSYIAKMYQTDSVYYIVFILERIQYWVDIDDSYLAYVLIEFDELKDESELNNYIPAISQLNGLIRFTIDQIKHDFTVFPPIDEHVVKTISRSNYLKWERHLRGNSILNFQGAEEFLKQYLLQSGVEII